MSTAWRHIFEEEFCDCGDDCDLYCCALFCPWFSSGYSQRDIGKSCCFGCMCAFCMGGFLRGRIKTALGMEPACFPDCLARKFCHVCAMTQEARAIRAFQKHVDTHYTPGAIEMK